MKGREGEKKDAALERKTHERTRMEACEKTSRSIIIREPESRSMIHSIHQTNSRKKAHHTYQLAICVAHCLVEGGFNGPAPPSPLPPPFRASPLDLRAWAPDLSLAKSPGVLCTLVNGMVWYGFCSVIGCEAVMRILESADRKEWE